MTYSINLPRTSVIAFLASIYILGFIVTPYWTLRRSVADAWLFLAITAIAGSIWLLRSTNSLQIEFGSRDLVLFFLLLAGIVVLNFRPLNSVIPFRGDEALHIERTLAVTTRIPRLESLILAILFLGLTISGLIKRPVWMISFGLLIITGAARFFLHENSFADVQQHPIFFLRYPFINYWFFALLPKLASLITHPYYEALYRVTPVLSMIGIAWIFQKKLGIPGWMNNIAWGFAIATIPLIFYYSSILYIEPPAVLLMTVVCLDINNLLHKNSNEISKSPSWYALVLTGFVKETTIPFLLCFIAIRMIVQLHNWSKRTPEERSARTLKDLLTGELGISFVLLAPVLFYIYCRATLTSTRSFTPVPSNLLDLNNYYFIGRSFVEQFGSFLFFFLAGCILLLKNREFTSVFSYLAFIFAILAFHLMDYKVYAGYSRFNLFVLPPILAGSAKFIRWVTKQTRYVGSGLAAAAIVSNLLLSPVHLDGVKTPYWGNYLIDTSEHYYPYQDALIWLKNNQAKKRMLFTGLDFYYPLQFYWNKLDWKPRREGLRSEEEISNETIAIARILSKAETERYSVIVYRVIDEKSVLPSETGEFRRQVIKNSAHSLIIFYKP